MSGVLTLHIASASHSNILPPPFPPELPGQLTFKTSSSKKRKLAPPLTSSLDSRESLSPDTAIPSCEPDDDVSLSFSGTPIASGLEAPQYVRGDSIPASSVPPRLQTHASSLVSADYASSVASSPSASVCPDPSLDSDRGGDETASSYTYGRSQSPFRISKKAIMNGDAELPHRSSSPLKRRASSMDPEADVISKDGDAGDVEMTTSNSATTVLPRAMSVDVPDPVEPSGTDESAQPPPLMEQVKTIETLLKAFGDSPVKEGDKTYLVSRKWVDKALALRYGSKQSKAEPDETPLGPVDNSDIIEEVIQEPGGGNFIRLKPGSGLEEFELFPEDAWKLVMEWYGIKEGQEPIVRSAINTAVDAQSPPTSFMSSIRPSFEFIACGLKSRKYRAQTFIKDLKNLTDIPLERKIRIFSVIQPLPAGNSSEPRSALTPPDSPGRIPDSNTSQNLWSTLLVDVSSYTAVPRDNRTKVQLEDHTVNDKYNGSASLQIFDLVTDQTLVLDEAIEKAFVSTFTGQSSSAGKSIPTRTNTNAPSSKPNSSRSSPAPEGPVTRGRNQKKGYGRGVGAVGLHNLGNTCYMNSALQCFRSVEELSKYFLTDSYKDEINKTNPLGYNGKVALAYGSLLREIYEEGRGSVSPRDFKNTVGRCRSTFAGWGQQDSQEFLGFLLDALQEDLSRIKNKPYIEKPDSTDDMVNNPEAIREMADKVWDITRKRDDSVIADLFTGMYKSTLKCPECGKISITFDPFNNLTLPLPVENMWTNTVKFFPLNDVPVKIEVELPKHSSMEALKQFLSLRTGVPAERLMGAEEFKDRFFKIYDNNSDVSEEIQSSDFPTFHELEAVPTNWPGKGQQKKPRSMLDFDTPPETTEWDDPMTGGDGTSPPHFITLTREEASNYDMIRRKVLEKVATFSTWSKFTMEEDSESTDAVDTDMVITTASDADSSGDSKIISKSIEGEDDIVDITMKDAATSSNSPSIAPITQPKVLKHFNTRRPKFIRPDQFLDPEFKSLFDLSYFTNGGDGAVPTGWSSAENNRLLPKLSDRIPEPPVKEEDEPSPEGWNSTASGNEESSNDEASAKPDPSQTRMVDESSEDDTPLALAKYGNRQNLKGPAGRKKFKNNKTYGKKANKRREKQMRGAKQQQQQQRAAAVAPQPMPPAVADGGPLIRLYEGLVVDWNEEAWEVVFGQTAKKHDPAQGSKTFVDIETLNDPALKISQRKRASRRSRGITLDECLDEFERAEVLSEQDMWYCPRCKEHRRASKKFDLWKTPDYLVAHLKRFSSSGWRRDKLDVVVDFPIEALDLTSRVIQKDDGKEEIYDLIAVDDHYGGLGGGHYTAYAKNFVDGRWYNYNDSSVTPVSDPSSVVTSAAYLLFYRRRTTTQRGGERFGQIFDKYNSDTNGEEGSADSGEEEHPGGVSILKPAANRTAIKSLVDSNDEEVPSYEAATGGATIHDSIEDDGHETSNPYQQVVSGPKSIDMTQGWTFNSLDGSGADGVEGPEGPEGAEGVEGSTAADYASDDAQFNSSDDERGGSRDFFDKNTRLTPAEAVDGFLDGEAQTLPEGNSEGKSWEKGG
ncbi:Ubiquitin carboxyl-terminal hydrolase 12 [Cladobotryum mycophilum]|uniref:ubiquitinyl hydrolase 1 n=1 Tax=Cladobotryum mycophilum TaxID=491253 RepID=A0ABR0SDN2_9HYPO